MQLKHLFVFLLFLLISVAESTVYSQESTSNYYQSSKITEHKKINYKNTKRISVKSNPLSNAYFLSLFITEIHIKNELQNKIQRTFILQKQVYLKIALLNNQHTFLTSQITSSNSNS